MVKGMGRGEEGEKRRTNSEGDGRRTRDYFGEGREGLMVRELGRGGVGSS